MLPSPPHREYILGTWGFMALYVLAIVATSRWVVEPLRGTPVLYALALLPSLAIAGQLWVTLRLMNRVDEFLRAVMTKRFVAASAVAFMLATTWGFLETIAEAPHLPGWLIYPAFWGAFGLVSPFIRTSRP